MKLVALRFFVSALVAQLVGGAFLFALSGLVGVEVAEAYPLDDRSDFVVGDAPSHMAIGDFNGDGMDDIVTANYAGNDISVLIATGSDSFATAVSYDAGFTEGSAIGIGHVNSDSNLDIIALFHNSSSARISVFRGNGDGTFQTPVNTTAGGASTSGGLIVADFNDDSLDDVVVSTGTTIKLYSSNGSGGLTLAYNQSYTGELKRGDFNNDGRYDFGLRSGNAVRIFRNNGDATWTNMILLSASGTYINDFAIADINGDLNEDIITITGLFASTSNMIEKFTGNGSFGFSGPTTLLSGASSGGRRIVIGNVRDSLDPDFIIADNSAIELRIDAGDGIGGQENDFHVYDLSPDFVLDLHLGDFDNDSRLDVVTLNYSGNSVSVYFNNMPPEVEDINVSATIDPFIEFAIRNTDDNAYTSTCAFGTLSTISVSTCAYRLAAGTNATNGFTVSVYADGGFVSGSDQIDDITENSTVTAGTENYGIAVTAATGLTEEGDFNDDDTPVPTTTVAIISDTGPFAYTEGDTTTSSLITHRAAIDALTPAGTYTQVVTYTATANF